MNLTKNLGQKASMNALFGSVLCCYNMSKCFVLICSSRKSLINVNMEGIQAGNSGQAPPVLPMQPVPQGPPGPPVAPLNPDSIMASAQGGSFLLQSVEQYVTLSEEQRKMFTALFFKKMLQDLANRKSKEEAEAKQYKAAKASMRKNELRIQKDKMKKSLHNQWLIEILFKMKYNLEDSFECYDFLGEDLSAEGEVNQALGPLFALN